MRPVSTAVRTNLNKAALAVSRKIYKLSRGRAAKYMFSCSVAPCHLKTDVKIVTEDSESVTIAKYDSDGKMKSGDFRVLSTTDLHLGDDPALRKKALQLLENHIIETRPDLVVFTGDIILSRFQQIDAVQFAQFMENIGIYWAIVFGNHEAREEKGFFKYLLMKSVSSFPHCLARHGRDELYGYGNYSINILGADNRLQQTLFFFDSGRTLHEYYVEKYNIPADAYMKGYDFIKPTQIDWYREQLTSLRERFGDVKSMMYMHIPIKEYELAFAPDGNGGFAPTGECEILYGHANEGVGSSAFNSGLFDAILDEKSTQAVFCGHDHMNGFCAKYKGVCLVYNQCCGYETYDCGSERNLPEKDWVQGVTVTDIAPDGSVSISNRLNSTYLK